MHFFVMWEALKMLDKYDVHRLQAAIFLKYSLKCGAKLIDSIGLTQDFQTFINSVDKAEVAFSWPESLTPPMRQIGQDFKLEFTSEEDFNKLKAIKALRADVWEIPFEENGAHMQYKNNMDRFRSVLKVSLSTN